MELTLNLNKNSYSIILGNSILQIFDKYISLDRKVLVISDKVIPSIYYQTILDKCHEGFLYLIESGESSKNIKNYELINKYLLDNNFSKDDLIIGVGGGVVGDLSAFIASTYKRGIDYVSVPTSSLAMIDSSIGGKTAIDLNGVKNAIGTFYQPKLVVIDFSTLKTLDKRHLNNGLIEALKAGLINDDSILDLFNDYENNLEEIIIRSLKVKISIVEKDEFDKSIRKYLNLGHTFGHAFESYSDYNLLHGEAVGKGLLYVLNDDLKKKVKSILERLEIPLNYSFDKKKILELIKNDKKVIDRQIELIMLDKINKPKIEKISFEEVEKLLERGGN